MKRFNVCDETGVVEEDDKGEFVRYDDLLELLHNANQPSSGVDLPTLRMVTALIMNKSK